jgi:hypothetical protein
MSTLLEQASLVLIPSGYKEDTVYSVIPSNGSGDLSFTRASNGTRINSDGLVEVTPWNLAQQSENFSNIYWSTQNAIITSNTTTAPNGTLTADTFTGSSATAYLYTTTPFTISGYYTFNIYVKASSLTSFRLDFAASSLSFGATSIINLATGTSSAITYYGGASNYTVTVELVTNGWYRCSIGGNIPTTQSMYCEILGNIGTLFVWGAQLNIGSTAKPYFPTTDRLNVPRLTYQNGGGGCPSLLLEKQSTNISAQSENFNGWATKINITTTANYATSPDGTTNASRLQFTGGGFMYGNTGFGQTNSTVYTLSCWAKRNGSGTQSVGFFVNGSGGVDSAWSLTSEYQRFTYTYTAGNSSTVGIGGASGADVSVWGWQFEASSYATSYIPTTTASATRIADACSKTGISSLIGQSEGVLFADFVYLGQTQSEVIDISDGTEDNRIMCYINSSVLFQIYVTVGGTTDGLISTSFSPVAGTRYKIAIGYKLNDIIFYVNGTSLGTDTSTTIPATSKLTISNGGASNYLLASQFNQAILFKTRLTNAQLATLTTI